jgi:hypothetical protein
VLCLSNFVALLTHKHGTLRIAASRRQVEAKSTPVCNSELTAFERMRQKSGKMQHSRAASAVAPNEVKHDPAAARAADFPSLGAD